MAWVDHYRFSKPFPDRLHYAHASVVLEVIQKKGAEVWERSWLFQARKLTQAGTTCVIHRTASLREMQVDLYQAGFPATNRFVDPQRRIMDRRCQMGYASIAKLKIHSKTGLRS